MPRAGISWAFSPFGLELFIL